MIGLIAKIWGMFLAFIFVILVILALTGVCKPGTISLSKPDVAPCQAIIDREKPKPHIVEVRWLWEPKAYGWGCYYEYDISTHRTITPMPK
jgi:hypothetical protein